MAVSRGVSWSLIPGRSVWIEAERAPRRQLGAEATQATQAARADRIIWDAAVSADEAARYEHRRRVVAPLLMLLALGLLFAAGWSW